MEIKFESNLWKFLVSEYQHFRYETHSQTPLMKLSFMDLFLPWFCFRQSIPVLWSPFRRISSVFLKRIRAIRAAVAKYRRAVRPWVPAPRFVCGHNPVRVFRWQTRLQVDSPRPVLDYKSELMCGIICLMVFGSPYMLSNSLWGYFWWSSLRRKTWPKLVVNSCNFVIDAPGWSSA